MKLAKLVGTEKQTRWAERIRIDRFKAWQESTPGIFKDIESMLLQEDSAGWWIANRDRSVEDVYKHMLYGVKSTSHVPKKEGRALKKAYDQAWERASTPKGFILIGETRNIITGEVVNDDSLPF